MKNFTRQLKCKILKKDYIKKKCILRWSSKIKLTVSNIELAWLYHEIGRSYYALKDFQNSLKYGMDSAERAILGMDELWYLNANILIAKSYSNLHKIPEATEIYLKALEISKVT